MKRPPPLDSTGSSRRKRVLSGEERVLWDSVAKSVKPLRKKPSAMKSEPSEEAAPAIAPSPEKPRELAFLPPHTAKAPVKKTPAHPPLAPIGRRERSQLSKGRKEIDARLDLHGMTQTRAHRALLAFLHRASDDGLSYVLVITGKGTSGDGPERGILRRQVPEWLSLPQFRSLVVGFEEAHIGHGGTGALYVRIRRAR